MSGLFLSYRRDDSRDIAGRLSDRLRQDFGAEQLFLDIDAIPAGTDFEAVLTERLQRCDVLLAMIGPQWENIADAGGQRRLDDPQDFVRREIAAALRRNDVRVIPVLVSGARMPRAENLPDDLKALAARQSYELRYERFNADANDLVAQLTTVVKPQRQPRYALWAAGALGLLALLAAGAMVLRARQQPPMPRVEVSVLRDEAIRLCKEASEVVARLASTSNAQDWAAARDRFWVLYKGPLYTIETKEKQKSPDGTSPLEAAMVEFGRQLDKAGETPKLPLQDADLDRRALSVAKACAATVERM